MKLQIKKIDLFTFLETSIIFAMKNEIGERPERRFETRFTDVAVQFLKELDVKERAVVIVACGFIKKTNKTPNTLIEKAITMKNKYYIEKSNANENL